MALPFVSGPPRSVAHPVPHAIGKSSRVPCTCPSDSRRSPRRSPRSVSAPALAASANAKTPPNTPSLEVLSAFVKLPATESKLMRLKLNELQTICSKLGIATTDKKANCTQAILESLADPPRSDPTAHLRDYSPAGVQHQQPASHPAPRNSHESTHASGDDDHTPLPGADDPRRSSGDAWDASQDSAESNSGEGGMWDSSCSEDDGYEEHSSEDDGDVWGPGRSASELDPDALDHARQVMEAALQGPGDASDAYVDPFASTAEDARRSWMHTAAGDHVGRFRSFMRGRVQEHVAGNPTGVSVTWLGTSSGAPTRTRNNSGIALRATAGARDDIMLVDVGEGTLMQLEAVGLDAAQVHSVCITHHHGDHCFGLPALVQARHELQLERSGVTTPLHVFGPPGTARFVVESVRSDHVPAPGFPAPPPMRVTVTEWALGDGPAAAGAPVTRAGVEFEVTRKNPDQATGTPPLGVREVRQFAFCRRPGTSGRSEENKFPLFNGLSWSVQLPNGWTVAAAQLRHRVPCWGYVFLEPQGGEGRRRRKVCLLGDTCDSRAIRPLAQGCDLLSHESTFLHAMLDKARIATHSTGRQAGEFAAQVGARQLVLTHFSGRYQAASVAPAAAPSADDEEEQAASLTMLKREADSALRGAPVACAFDGFTWRVARPGEAGGGVREPWAAQTSLKR